VPPEQTLTTLLLTDIASTFPDPLVLPKNVAVATVDNAAALLVMLVALPTDVIGPVKHLLHYYRLTFE
jgi:hypothetical protein